MTSVPPVPRIEDPDVALLAGIAGTLAADYVDLDAAWAGSPFAWIKTRPSRQVGKIGEQLVAGWAAAKGLPVIPTGDSEADRVINGRRTEIKFSTLWAGGNFVFQQIRDQRYDQILLLGIAPFSASCWVVPKNEIVGKALAGLRGQHAGAAARDTQWLQFPASDAPTWLANYGGTLKQAYELLR